MDHLSRDIILPRDADDALLVGRVWLPGDLSGPAPCLVRDGSVYDISSLAPTMSGLLERDDLTVVLADERRFPKVSGIEPVLANSHYTRARADTLHLLAPCDLQTVKAAGVTFVISLFERVIEEHARGDKGRADEIRAELQEVVGDDLAAIVPGSDEAMRLKQVLIDKGAWSQYLEVGIGPTAEIFTKCPPMASVGTGAEIGVRADSTWNNPEPEVVLAVTSKGNVVGATLGNDVNHRDFEGRSALLLSESKDNAASSAIGPFIRLFDGGFTLDDVRNADITLTVTGEDGFALEGGSSMARIARDPAALAAQASSDTHHYPDGFVLYLGTMYAPVQDRDAPGEGFTHKLGDRVEISTLKLGTLVNWVNHSQEVPPWTFGTGALMQNLARRKLLG